MEVTRKEVEIKLKSLGFYIDTETYLVVNDNRQEDFVQDPDCFIKDLPGPDYIEARIDDKASEIHFFDSLGRDWIMWYRDFINVERVVVRSTIELI